MSFVLCWDIDGTLLSTGRAGIFAWEAACREIIGVEADLSCFPTAGRTDCEIALQILEHFGVSVSEERRLSLLRRYEEYLPECLPKKKGQVMPGIMDILNWSCKHRAIVNLLLTGNTREGAKAKLTYYGLDAFFTKGAFADNCPDRAAIAQIALRLATENAEDFSVDRMFVIGDTPHDIACGKVVGAKTIAVATGSYSVSELLFYHPWQAIEQLPASREFASLLGIPY